MGHYVTTYCSAHGEVDMDDGRAFCEDCYEVTPKGALAEARAEIERLNVENGRLTDVLLSRHGGEPLTLMDELDESRARIAELEADVVWCVENPYRLLDTSGMWDDVPGNAPNTVLLLKVREARNGVS